MHRRMTARTFAALVEPRCEYRAATRAARPHHSAHHPRRPRPEHVLLRTRLLLLRGPVGALALLFARLRVAITPLPILPLHEGPPGGCLMIPPNLLLKFPFTQDVWKGNRFLQWP